METAGVLILVLLFQVLGVSPTYGCEIYAPGALKPIYSFDRDDGDGHFTVSEAVFPKKREITTVIFDVGGVLGHDLLKPLRIHLADIFSEDFGLTESHLRTASERVPRLHADLGYEFDTGYHRRLLKEGLRTTDLGAQLGDLEIDRLMDTRIEWASWENTLKAWLTDKSIYHISKRPCGVQ